ESRTQQHWIRADLVIAREFLEGLAIAADMLEEVSIDAASAEDADGPVESAGIATRALQRLPGTLEKHTVLGIRQLRLARIHPEEFGVELIDVVENRPRLDEVGLPAHLVGKAVFELCFVEAGDRLDAVAQIAPELFDVARAGKTSRQADD